MNKMIAVTLLSLLAFEINAQEADTAFRKAAEKGQIEEVQALLKEGISINSIDDKGRTALILAAEKGRTEIVKLLLENGADIWATDNKNETALQKTRKKEVTTLLGEFIDKQNNLIIDKLLSDSTESVKINALSSLTPFHRLVFIQACFALMKKDSSRIISSNSINSLKAFTELTSMNFFLKKADFAAYRNYSYLLEYSNYLYLVAVTYREKGLQHESGLVLGNLIAFHSLFRTKILNSALSLLGNPGAVDVDMMIATQQISPKLVAQREIVESSFVLVVEEQSEQKPVDDIFHVMNQAMDIYPDSKSWYVDILRAIANCKNKYAASLANATLSNRFTAIKEP